jgi:hypothetical protein
MQISRYETKERIFCFSHPQLKILSKRLHEKYIRWNIYPEREENQLIDEAAHEKTHKDTDNFLVTWRWSINTQI